MRFIEYMPVGPSALSRRHLLSGADILARIEHLGRLAPVTHGRHDGPAERYRFDGAKGEIGLIFAMSRHFCATCNRLRLTASGKLRTCLLADESLDVKQVLRSGGSDRDLAALYREAARQKQPRHQMGTALPRPVQAGMSAIGG